MSGQAEAVNFVRPRGSATTTLEDQFFEGLRKACVPVSCYLMSGIKLEGRIDAVDHSVVYLKSTEVTTMVYKHAIASVVSVRKTVRDDSKTGKRAQ
jgi:RNA chaperone Hfq